MLPRQGSVSVGSLLGGVAMTEAAATAIAIDKYDDVIDDTDLKLRKSKEWKNTQDFANGRSDFSREDDGK